MNRLLLRIAAAFILLAGAGACGESGGIDTGNAITVQGTVAEGAAGSYASVTVRGANGAEVEAEADVSGFYEADVTRLVPPYFVRADLESGHTLYAFARASDDAAAEAMDSPVTGSEGSESSAGGATGPGQSYVYINVHPFSDLLVAVYYLALDLELDDVFPEFGPSSPYPSREEIESIIGPISDALVRAFPGGDLAFLADPVAYGSDGLALEAAFSPDGTGFDALLDSLTVAPDRRSFMIVNGDVQVEIGIAAVPGSPGDGRQLRFEMSAIGPSGDSGEEQLLLLPGDTELREAMSGAQSVIQRAADIANSRGTLLTASDLLPLFASDYLNAGENRDIAAARLAGMLRGKVVGAEPVRLVHYDRINKVVRVALGPIPQIVDRPLFVGSLEPPDAPPPPLPPGAGLPDYVPPPFAVLKRPPVEFTMIKGTSGWLFSGDRNLARRRLISIHRTIMTGTGTTVERVLLVEALAPQGLVSAASVRSLPSGTGVFPSATSLFLLPQPRTEIVKPTPNPADNLTLQRDVYSILQPLGPTPPAVGETFEITVTSAAPETADPAIQSRQLGANTTEAAAITSPTLHTLAAANLGGPLTIQWVLPKSYPIVSVQLIGRVMSGPNVCQLAPIEVSSADDQSQATISLPAVWPVPCGTSPGPLNRAEVELMVRGPRGEQSEVRYVFE